MEFNSSGIVHIIRKALIWKYSSSTLQMPTSENLKSNK